MHDEILWSTDNGSWTAQRTAEEFARVHWTEPRRIANVQPLRSGWGCTFALVNGNGGVYRVSADDRRGLSIVTRDR